MGSKTSTAKTETRPPEEVMAAYRALIERAQKDASRPYTNTLAPFNAQQKAAFQRFNEIPGQYLPQAQQYATQAAAPISEQQISNYYNPYQQSVIDATLANINETNRAQQGQVVGNAIAQGALGGNRVKIAQAELARQQGLANNQTLAGLNASNYQQALAAAQADREAAGQGVNNFLNLGQSALQGATAQLGAGTIQQDQATKLLQQKAAFPYQQTNWLSGIISGLGPLMGQNTTQQTPGPSLFSQLAGLGIAGLGAFGGKGRGGKVGYSEGGEVEPPTHRMAKSAIEISHILRRGIGGPAMQSGGIPGIATGIGIDASSPIFQNPDMLELLRRRSAGEGLDIQNSVRSGMFGPDWPMLDDPDAAARMATFDSALPQTSGIAANAPQLPAGVPESVAAPTGGEVGYNAPAAPSAGIAAANSMAAPQAGVSVAPAAAAQPTAAGNFGDSWRLPVIAAGLGIMASQSPFLGTAIGEGGLTGLQVWNAAKKAKAEAEMAAQETALRKASLDLEAKRLDQQAEQFAKNLALETEKFQAESAPGIKPTDDIREYEFAKSEGFEGSFADWQMARAKAGATNIDLGENSFAKAFGTENAKQFFERRQGALDAAASLSANNEARSLLDSGVITGFGATYITNAGNALRQLGFNVDEDPIANTQAFVATRAQEVGRIIKLFGAGTGLSDADREFATKAAAGDINLNEQALRRIIDINERASRNILNTFNKDAAQVPADLSPYPLIVPIPEVPKPPPPAGNANNTFDLNESDIKDGELVEDAEGNRYRMINGKLVRQ